MPQKFASIYAVPQKQPGKKVTRSCAGGGARRTSETRAYPSAAISSAPTPNETAIHAGRGSMPQDISRGASHFEERGSSHFGSEGRYRGSALMEDSRGSTGSSQERTIAGKTVKKTPPQLPRSQVQEGRQIQGKRVDKSPTQKGRSPKQKGRALKQERATEIKGSFISSAGTEASGSQGR